MAEHKDSAEAHVQEGLVGEVVERCVEPEGVAQRMD
jgi:hypothetical protein